MKLSELVLYLQDDNREHNATTIQVTKNVTINCYHEMSLQIVKTKQSKIICIFDTFIYFPHGNCRNVHEMLFILF